MNVYGKNGSLIRGLYLALAAIWYLLTIGGRIGRKKIVTLCYHGIGPEQRWRFERQVKLRSRLFSAVRFTFDDAFENLLENAVSILQEKEIPTIIFAVPGNLGASPQWDIAPNHPEYNQKTMTAQQLKDIQSDLIKIGSHTQTHPDLSKLPPEQVRWELIESKKNLEQMLKKAIEDLALPHGAYNQEVLRIAQEVGYKRIYTLEPKLAYSQEAEVLGRFSMSPDVWPIEFYLTCVGAYQWLGPWRKMIGILRKWVQLPKSW